MADRIKQSLGNELRSDQRIKERVAVNWDGDQYGGILGEKRAWLISDHNNACTGLLGHLSGYPIQGGVSGETEYDQAVLLGNVAHMVDRAYGSRIGGRHMRQHMFQI